MLVLWFCGSAYFAPSVISYSEGFNRLKLPQCDLPALWNPRANQFFHVDALPLLGTGTLDLRGVKALAAGLAQAAEA